MLGLRNPIKGRLLYRLFRDKHVYVDGETRKVQISNSQETQPKPEQITSKVHCFHVGRAQEGEERYIHSICVWKILTSFYSPAHEPGFL